MFSPRLIFSVLWLSQIALHIGLHDLFFSFAEVTWFSIIILFVSFISGTYFFVNIECSIKASPKINKHDIQLFYWHFIIIYFFASAYAIFELYRMLNDLGGGDFNAGLIRKLVIDDFLEDRTLYSIFRIFYLGVGFSIFILSFSKDLSLTQLIIIFCIGLMSAVATTGRLYVLLFFIASSVLMYQNNIISKRLVFFGIFLFIALFFSLAIMFGKGDQDTVGTSILWNAQVYVMSSVACFNDYVLTGDQEIIGGAIAPNPVRAIFSFVGFEMPAKPSLLPFASVPLDCNTYTLLFPLFHDGGLIGVLLGGALLGLFHQYLYVKFQTSLNPLWWYIYAISLYPLVMSIFEDAYFSSPGFWMLLWIPPIIYIIFFGTPLGENSTSTPTELTLND